MNQTLLNELEYLYENSSYEGQYPAPKVARIAYDAYLELSRLYEKIENAQMTFSETSNLTIEERTQKMANILAC